MGWDLVFNLLAMGSHADGRKLVEETLNGLNGSFSAVERSLIAFSHKTTKLQYRSKLPSSFIGLCVENLDFALDS